MAVMSASVAGSGPLSPPHVGIGPGEVKERRVIPSIGAADPRDRLHRPAAPSPHVPHWQDRHGMV
jgi:hypothetical protein